jgi:hypothetical protein
MSCSVAAPDRHHHLLLSVQVMRISIFTTRSPAFERQRAMLRHQHSQLLQPTPVYMASGR